MEQKLTDILAWGPSGLDIVRVFPRRTAATPEDPMAFVGEPPLWRPEAREVQVSCTFTWDRPLARDLARSWRRFYPVVKLGGPAFDDPGGEFVPGMYLKPGYVITSRGCPRHCPFCLVPRREGRLRTLPIRDGWDVLDNNLLACPPGHLQAVLTMLDRQPRRARFTGGLEAARITPEIARWLVAVRFDLAYTAYDRAEQRPDVERAIMILREAGGWSLRRSQKKLSCYVLCGLPGDTAASIEHRLEWDVSIGATPFPMFYRNPTTAKDRRIDELKRSLRRWMRPAAIFAKDATA